MHSFAAIKQCILVQSYDQQWCRYWLLLFVVVSAADWKLDEPDWTGRLKVVSKGSDVVLQLEDSNTGQCTSFSSSS